MLPYIHVAVLQCTAHKLQNIICSLQQSFQNNSDTNLRLQKTYVGKVRLYHCILAESHESQQVVNVFKSHTLIVNLSELFEFSNDLPTS